MEKVFKIITLLHLAPDMIRTGRYLFRDSNQVTIDIDFLNSIRGNGVLQPLIVENIEGIYELISGSRRLKAAKTAGLNKIPVLVVSGFIAPLLNFLENEHHKSTNMIDRAESLKHLMNMYKLSQIDFANLIGMSTSSLNDEISLCKLSDKIKADVRSDASIAKRDLIQLSRIKDQDEQISLYFVIKSKKLIKKPLNNGNLSTTAINLIKKTTSLSSAIVREFRTIPVCPEKNDLITAFQDLHAILGRFLNDKEKISLDLLKSCKEVHEHKRDEIINLTEKDKPAACKTGAKIGV
jgi:ParB/RepB/Spo0J family partition protein